MTLKFSTTTPSTHPLVIPFFAGQNHPLVPKKLNFKGEKDEIISIHQPNGQKTIFYGLGKEKDLTASRVRNFAAKWIKSSKPIPHHQLIISIPYHVQKYSQELGEGLILGNYNSALYKTGSEKQKQAKEALNTIHLVAKTWPTSAKTLVTKGQAIAEVVNHTRDLVNRGPDRLNTTHLVKEAQSIAKRHQHKFTNLKKSQLQKLKMGGILAVNQASSEPAHLIILEHQAQLKEKPIVLVGKGITFDTGGINLKPAAHMHEMQMDMAGAATVLGVFQLLKQLNIKKRVVGILPITDNAINQNAYRPSEIITTYSGQTVEILNTDAEGRLILADGLYYGATKYQPQYLIDIATLTGSCMAALGFRTAGLMGNDPQLTEKLITAGQHSDEALCQFPITDIDEKSMKGKLADLTNLDSEGRFAGASRAAAFLKNFVKDTKWAHIDIAGTAFTKEPKDYEISMATGFGVRMFIEFLENL